MFDEKFFFVEQGVMDGILDIFERGNIDKEDNVEDKVDGFQK